MEETTNDKFAKFSAKFLMLSLEPFIVKELGIEANKFDSLHPYQSYIINKWK